MVESVIERDRAALPEEERSFGLEKIEPGCWWMCRDITEEYARQMTAEYRDDETRLWKCPEGRKNHYFDCEVMAAVAMDYLQIRFWPQPEADK